MGELGTMLREARESQGFSLEQAEQETRIRRVFLEALEEERFDQLPGDVYIRGFIRNYGRFLGLDTQDLLPVYCKATGDVLHRMPQVLNEPLLPTPAGNVWSTVFLVVMIAIVLGLAGWYGYQRLVVGIDPFAGITRWIELQRPTMAPATSTTIPTSGAALTATRAVAVHPTETALPSQQAVAPAATATRRVVNTPTQRATRRVEPSRTPIPSPTRTRDPNAAPAEIEGIEVRVEALEKCYVFVLSDGEVVYEEILDSGQEEIWIAQEEMTVRVGNAAGVRVYVNGVEVPPLGEPGQVVELEYTLDTLPPG